MQYIIAFLLAFFAACTGVNVPVGDDDDSGGDSIPSPCDPASFTQDFTGSLGVSIDYDQGINSMTFNNGSFDFNYLSDFQIVDELAGASSVYLSGVLNTGPTFNMTFNCGDPSLDVVYDGVSYTLTAEQPISVYFTL